MLATNSNPSEEANQYCSSTISAYHLIDEQNSIPERNSSFLALMILYEQDDFLL